MKRILPVIFTALSISTFSLWAGDDAWTRSGSHYSYTKTAKIAAAAYGEGGCKYTFSVGCPAGSFDTSAGATSGSPSGIDLSISSGSATGVIEYVATNLPSNDVSISMSGKLIIPGGSGNTQPTWGASATGQAPFFVSPKEQVAIGEAPVVQISASDNANWSMAGHSKSDSDMVVIEGLNTIFTNTWSVANGTYSVTATKVGGTASDTASFKICQHGEWGNHSGGFSFTLNPALTGKINNAISKIPGVNVSLKSVSASITGRERVFCCDNAEEKTETEITKNFSLSATISNDIPIWGWTTPKPIMLGNETLGVEFDAELGLILKPGTISFGVEQKATEDECSTEEACVETYATGSWSPSLQFGVEAIGCVKVFGMVDCADIEATGAISSTVSAGVGYKLGGCESTGWTGKASIGQGNLAVVVGVDGFTWQNTWQIWEGEDF